MKPHLLLVDQPVIAFESLLAAMRQAGERAGWLELDTAPEVPAELEQAACRGVLRAVAISGGRSLAVKPMTGAPVLRDVLREHFRGCALVLIRGPIAEAAPRLRPQGADWLVEPPGQKPRSLNTDRLIAALRKPRPWGGEAGAAPE